MLDYKYAIVISLLDNYVPLINLLEFHMIIFIILILCVFIGLTYVFMTQCPQVSTCFSPVDISKHLYNVDVIQPDYLLRLIKV